MAGGLRVTVAPGSVALRPGESADIEVTVQNTGSSVQHYGASLLGLPDSAYEYDPATVRLKPREVASVRLKLTVPERSDLVDGVYVLGVLVRSPHERQLSRCEELRLDVKPEPRLSLAVQPEAAEGGRRADYRLAVGNEGNTALSVTLQASDPESAVSYQFQPRGLDVPAGGSATATLTARAPVPWTGQPKRRAITVRAGAGRDLHAEKSVVLTQRPRIAGGLLRLAGMATAVVVLAAATIVAALLTRAREERAEQPQQPQQTIVSPPSPTTPASSAAPSSAAPSSAPASSPSGLPPGTTAIVDFTLLPDGKPVDDRIIPPDFYAGRGVTLTTLVDRAPPACANATAVAVRRRQDRGSFLTSSTPGNVAACNTLPIRLTLAAPASAVTLMYIGTGKENVLIAELSDGTTQQVTGSAANLVVEPLPYRAPRGRTVLAVVYGNNNPDPAAALAEFTQVKRLTFVVAG